MLISLAWTKNFNLIWYKKYTYLTLCERFGIKAMFILLYYYVYVSLYLNKVHPETVFYITKYIGVLKVNRHWENLTKFININTGNVTNL